MSVKVTIMCEKTLLHQLRPAQIAFSVRAGRSARNHPTNPTPPHTTSTRHITSPHITSHQIFMLRWWAPHPLWAAWSGVSGRNRTDTCISMNGLLKRRTFPGSRFSALAVMGAIDGPRYGLDLEVATMNMSRTRGSPWMDAAACRLLKSGWSTTAAGELDLVPDARLNCGERPVPAEAGICR